jgi:adenosylhomocysteine nucleosidase
VQTVMSECMFKSMPKIAIVAAMEREVSPLIRSWKVRTLYQGEHALRRYRLFESGETALICGGIGAEAARRATEALIQEVNPGRVISVGFAGALDASLQIGDVLMPRHVINSADGVRTDVGAGDGVLVSSANVVGKDQKLRFAKAYAAVAVDMEAAAVAQGAQARGVEFGVIKVISDASNFNMPALDRFVTADGTFRSVNFAAHVALRPWLWQTAIALARNSSKASRALCQAISSYIESYLERETRGPRILPREASREALTTNSSVDEFDSAATQEFAGAHTAAALVPHTQSKGKQQENR